MQPDPVHGRIGSGVIEPAGADQYLAKFLWEIFCSFLTCIGLAGRLLYHAVQLGANRQEHQAAWVLAISPVHFG